MIDVTFPLEQDQIAEVLDQIATRRAELGKELDALSGLVKAVQSQCSHPEKDYHNPMGRWEYYTCTICGKEV